MTEADVVNEEMYEEEDDDLLFRYRHLASHLQTDSELFNRRLQAYLANQMGIRSAMGHYVTSQYAQQQQFSNAAPYGGGQLAMYPAAPVGPAFAMQTMHRQANQLGSPLSTYRQAPYSVPNLSQGGGHRPTVAHRRAVSISHPIMAGLMSPSPTSPVDDKRRMSLASAPATTESALGPQSPPLSATATPKTQPTVTPHVGTPHVGTSHVGTSHVGTPHVGTSHVGTPHMSTPQPLAEAYGVLPQYPLGDLNDPTGYALLSVGLPPESQQFCGSALGPQDQVTSLLMAGSSYLPPVPLGLENAYGYANGALAAPADAKLEMDIGAAIFPGFDGLGSAFDPGDGYHDEYHIPPPSYFEDGTETTGDSSTNTPGEFTADFNLFINPDQWVEVSNNSQ